VLPRQLAACGNELSTDRTKLALRRQSIRTLTPSELGIPHGGALNTGATA
jgi:hypothetical protein